MIPTLGYKNYAILGVFRSVYRRISDTCTLPRRTVVLQQGRRYAEPQESRREVGQGKGPIVGVRLSEPNLT